MEWLTIHPSILSLFLSLTLVLLFLAKELFSVNNWHPSLSLSWSVKSCKWLKVVKCDTLDRKFDIRVVKYLLWSFCSLVIWLTECPLCHPVSSDVHWTFSSPEKGNSFASLSFILNYYFLLPLVLFVRVTVSFFYPSVGYPSMARSTFVFQSSRVSEACHTTFFSISLCWSFFLLQHKKFVAAFAKFMQRERLQWHTLQLQVKWNLESQGNRFFFSTFKCTGEL